MFTKHPNCSASVSVGCQRLGILHFELFLEIWRDDIHLLALPCPQHTHTPLLSSSVYLLHLAAKYNGITIYIILFLRSGILFFRSEFGVFTNFIKDTFTISHSPIFQKLAFTWREGEKDLNSNIFNQKVQYYLNFKEE